MKKLIIITPLLISVLSGCSAMRAIEFTASDMGYWEYQFVQNLAHGRDVITTCNSEGYDKYDLSITDSRLSLSFKEKSEFKMWSESIRTSFVSESECKTWKERVKGWENTGELPLLGGSLKDEKWNLENRY